MIAPHDNSSQKGATELGSTSTDEETKEPSTPKASRDHVSPEVDTQTTYYEFRVVFTSAGSFAFEISYESSDGTRSTTPEAYINVEPVLRLQGADGNERQMQCKELSICSVLSRCLGPLTRWQDVLRPVSQLGYNAIHFTPI